MPLSRSPASCNYKKIIWLTLIIVTALLVNIFTIGINLVARMMSFQDSGSQLQTGNNPTHLQYNYTDPRPLLVDVTEKFLSGWFSNNHSEREINNDNISHKMILWYNIPDWLNLDKLNDCQKACSYRNCEFTKDVKLIRNSSAIIFTITTKGISKIPPLQHSERPENQVWIFFGMESPIYLDRFYGNLRPVWKLSLNWSMNYRVNSDLIVPYGYLKSREVVPERNYSKIYRDKTKIAAWVVSNCKTESFREKFVERLKENGLEIDIYGFCGQKLKNDPQEMIDKKYKFYLSFENSICLDYVTEKYFKYYQLDVILIVRGGSDYKKLLPHNTYINTEDFQNFSELVEHIQNVGSNESLYTEYLKRKDKYIAVSGVSNMCPSFCALCMKLNNLEPNRRVYETVPKYLETCHAASDIDKMAMKSPRT